MSCAAIPKIARVASSKIYSMILSKKEKQEKKKKEKKKKIIYIKNW